MKCYNNYDLFNMYVKSLQKNVKCQIFLTKEFNYYALIFHSVDILKINTIKLYYYEI